MIELNGPQPLGKGGASADERHAEPLAEPDFGAIAHQRKAENVYQTAKITPGAHVSGDLDASLDFLSWLRPEGPWPLTAIPPDGGRTATATFDPGSEQACREWLAKRNGIENLYFMVNAPTQHLTSKAKKEQVLAFEFFHVDLDPAKPPKEAEGDPAAMDAWNTQERARLLETLQGWRYIPSAIIDSGGGYQAFWRLDEPILVNGQIGAIEEAEAYNIQLSTELGGDNCHNADRIMRLPGTINLPGESKRKKGRRPALARVVELRDKAYPVSLFNGVACVEDAPQGAPRTRVNISADLPLLSPTLVELPKGISPRIRQLIVSGDDAEKPYKSRSEAVWAVLFALIHAGCDDDLIAAVLLEPVLGISAHNLDQRQPRAYVTGQIQKARDKIAQESASKGVQLDDFRADMNTHSYIFMPTGRQWPSASVNSRLPPVQLRDGAGNPLVDEKGKPQKIPANVWLDQNRPVEGSTWAPGEPQVIEGRLVAEGGWISRPGCNTFNMYRPPVPLLGDATQAGPWLERLRRVYPHDARHLERWFAHRVQRPHEKINHAIVLGGEQGIGKDSLLEPLKRAVGPWNVAEVTPMQMLGTRFNGYAKSVILRVSETRDLGDWDRFAFHDFMKPYIAAPPDVLRVDEKNLPEHAVINVTGIIFTSNHRLDGLYLPPGDRRHFVAWSELTQDDFPDGYWEELWGWYETGGYGHVAAYLSALDLSDFNAKAPPPKTEAFWAIVEAHSPQEDADLADALEALERPGTVTVNMIADKATPDLATWLRASSNARKVRLRLERAGYVFCRNPDVKDGRHKVGGKWCTIYARKDLTQRDALAAIAELARVTGEHQASLLPNQLPDGRPIPPQDGEPY